MAKSSYRMLLKQNAPRKERWRFFLVETEALLLLQKSSLGQALQRTATNRMVEGDFNTVKNGTIETDITRNMVENKTTNGWSSNVLGKQSSGKTPNLQLAGRLAHFRKNWEKLTQD